MALKRVTSFSSLAQCCIRDRIAAASYLHHRPRLSSNERQSSQACIRTYTASQYRANNTEPHRDALETQHSVLEQPISPPSSTSSSIKTFSHQLANIKSTSTKQRSHSPRYDLERAPTLPSDFLSTASIATPTQSRPLALTDSLLETLPHLTSQPPFYATIHIHGKPYLVTEGDSVRLPFLMHGVFPGDILRLDRVSKLGSRDWTLCGGSAPLLVRNDNIDQRELDGEEIAEPEAMMAGTEHELEAVVGKTDGLEFRAVGTGAGAHHYRAKKHNRPGYLDSRLFEIRATVMGTENEPMRVKEKTKQRQRHVRHVRSKLRYTIITISEIKIKTAESLLTHAG